MLGKYANVLKFATIFKFAALFVFASTREAVGILAGLLDNPNQEIIPIGELYQLIINPRTPDAEKAKALRGLFEYISDIKEKYSASEDFEDIADALDEIVADVKTHISNTDAEDYQEEFENETDSIMQNMGITEGEEEAKKKDLSVTRDMEKKKELQKEYLKNQRTNPLTQQVFMEYERQRQRDWAEQNRERSNEHKQRSAKKQGIIKKLMGAGLTLEQAREAYEKQLTRLFEESVQSYKSNNGDMESAKEKITEFKQRSEQRLKDLAKYYKMQKRYAEMLDDSSLNQARKRKVQFNMRDATKSLFVKEQIRNGISPEDASAQAESLSVESLKEMTEQYLQEAAKLVA